MEAVLISE